jgi:hypothetical protein
MTVGTITPGVYCSVSADSPPLRYTTIQAPTPTMPVIAQDIIDLSQVVMNVQASSIDGIRGGAYAPTDDIALTDHGISVATNAAFRVRNGGYLNIENMATVQSAASAAWGGTYAFNGATIGLDATSVLSFATGALMAGTIGMYGTMNVLNQVVLKNGGYGMSVEQGVAVDCYNAGGHVLPKAAALDLPDATPYVYASAEAVPENLSITISGSADGAVTIPQGVGGQWCSVSTLTDAGTHKVSVTLLGGSATVSQDFQNTAAAIVWADYWCDGTNWIPQRSGKF